MTVSDFLKASIEEAAAAELHSDFHGDYPASLSGHSIRQGMAPQNVVVSLFDPEHNRSLPLTPTLLADIFAEALAKVGMGTLPAPSPAPQPTPGGVPISELPLLPINEQVFVYVEITGRVDHRVEVSGVPQLRLSPGYSFVFQDSTGASIPFTSHPSEDGTYWTPADPMPSGVYQFTITGPANTSAQVMLTTVSNFS